MSFLMAAPDLLVFAASDLAGIGAGVSQAHTVAARSMTGLLPVAGDEVSTAIATLFSSHGEQFQTLSAQAAAFPTEFAQALRGAGGAYAASEAHNVEQTLLGVINAPTEALLGRR
jgi:hypothetical protein